LQVHPRAPLETRPPQARGEENQKQLRRAQQREVPGSREDGETDRRSGDVSPRCERDPVLTDRPVQAAPGKADREDEDRHPDEEALPEALVRRVARIRPDGDDAVEKRGHHRRA
jgi:hypothetical protein